MKTEKTISRRQVIIGVVATLAVLGGGYVAYDSYMFVSTDNAMVQGAATLLSARVGGIIIKADVNENENVKAGQVLVELKPDDYRNALNQAESESESLGAQMKGAEASYNRAKKLLEQGASTPERFDAAESQFRSLQRKHQSAEAQVSQAKLNLDYTRIVAPADGKVGKKSFEVGMLAVAGQPLLGFVEGNERWVVANLKETDMDHVEVGKEAYVTVDAISGRTFKGTVESISPATGATFSLLPPDNATGNFTKVVQRVPVRIKLQGLTEHEIDRLQSGLSADVKLRVH